MDDHQTVVPTEGQGIATLEVQEGASHNVYVNAPGHKEASVRVQSFNDDIVLPPLEKLKSPSAITAPGAGAKTAPPAATEKPLPKCPGRWASEEGRCCKGKAVFGKTCQDL
jgi:hypothetical protein